MKLTITGKQLHTYFITRAQVVQVPFSSAYYMAKHTLQYLQNEGQRNCLKHDSTQFCNSNNRPTKPTTWMNDQFHIIIFGSVPLSFWQQKGS
jgi:hypothetical protein